MPLKSTQTVEITLPRAVDVPDLGGSAVGLEYVQQNQSNWCWAACMQMLILENEPELTQCKMANAAFGETGCCSVPGSFLCNKTMDVRSNRPGKPCIASEWERHGYSADYNESALEFLVVQEEINAGRPIEVGVLWTGGTGHAMMVEGWDIIDDEKIVVVLDPSKADGGRKTIQFDELLEAFGRGTLKWYWTNLRRRP